MPNKSIVVGLGGTGDWVLTFLKSRLHAAHGEDASKDVSFLLIDTIQEKVREDAFAKGAETITVGGGAQQHEEALAHLGTVRVQSHEYLPLTGEIHSTADRIIKGELPQFSWFQARFFKSAVNEAAFNISDGAGQWRQFGRIALALNAEKGAFKARLRRLIGKSGTSKRIMIYVVSSFAGGTGAGIFLDAAALIRAIAREAGVDVWLFGLFVFPSAFQHVLGTNAHRTTIPRSYAAFRELERFQTVFGKGADFPIKYSPNLKVEIDTALYDTVFLLDADVEWAPLSESNPWQGISPCVADGLEVFIDSEVGQSILEDLVNARARQNLDIQLDQTLPAQYHSLGSHRIMIPVRQYAARFAAQAIGDWGKSLFGASTGDKELEPPPPGAQSYRERAIHFLRSRGSNLATTIVDYLPGERSHENLKSFAHDSAEPYLELLRSREAASGDTSVFRTDPIKGVSTGERTREPAEAAATRIRRECRTRLEKFWRSADATLDEFVEASLEETRAEIRQLALSILNGDDAELRSSPAAAAAGQLDALAKVCDELVEEVLKPNTVRIEAMNEGHNTIARWNRDLSSTEEELQATHGMDSFFKKRNAWRRQREYLEFVTDHTRRELLEKVLGAFRQIIDGTATLANDLRRQVLRWADLVVLLEGVSAAAVATARRALVDESMKSNGRTFTSSYGLHPYVPDGELDITMGGYREKLYERYGSPLAASLISGTRWAVDADGSLHLAIDRESEGSISLEASSGHDIHKRIYSHVIKDLLSESKLKSLSIFDYFLSENISPERIASYLGSRTGPLLGKLEQKEESAIFHQTHLLARRPQDERATGFIAALEERLKGHFESATPAKSPDQSFDDPYTLTLLYLVQAITAAEIPKFREYTGIYREHILQGDAHLVNHVFTAEQQAAEIEKILNEREGTTGHAWTRLHPRVCRLLDRPDRLRDFLGLWALGRIGLKSTSDAIVKVWMALPSGVDDPLHPSVVWLTRPDDTAPDGVEEAESLLLALENYCFQDKSRKKGGEIKFRHADFTESLIQERNRRVHAGDAHALVDQLRSFLKGEFEGRIGSMRAHDEADDLRKIATHFLEKEIERVQRL